MVTWIKAKQILTKLSLEYLQFCKYNHFLVIWIKLKQIQALVPLILLKLNYKHEFGCILESILKHTFSVGEAKLAQITWKLG